MNHILKSIVISIFTISFLFGKQAFAAQQNKPFVSHNGQPITEQHILMRSIISAVRDAANRCDIPAAQTLLQIAYKSFAQFDQVDDLEKLQVLHEIEEIVRLAVRLSNPTSSGKKPASDADQKTKASEQTPSKKSLTIKEQQTLNQKLFLALMEYEPNINKIEQLLRAGANPNALIEKQYISQDYENYFYHECGIDRHVFEVGDPIYFLILKSIYDDNALANQKREFLINLFIKHGIDVNRKSQSGKTLLHKACLRGGSWIPALLTCKADAHAIDNEGNSIFHYLARGSICGISSKPVLPLLHDIIKQGYNVNLQNSKGQTPLMLAIGRLEGPKDRPANPNTIIIELLQQYNADPFISDNQGKTASDYVVFNPKWYAHWKEALRAVQAQFETYKKTYKQKYIDALNIETQQVLPARPLVGVIAQYLFGQ